MILIPTILWWITFPFIFSYFYKKKYTVLCVYIYIVISGRLPLPLLITSQIELWMVYGIIFIPLFMSKVLGSNKLSLIPSLILLSALATAFISSITLGAYNDGYLLLAIELVFMIGYILCIMHSSRNEAQKEIKESFLSSVIAITLIALIAQIMIILNVETCSSFLIYHPAGDIHCVPFLSFEIYRLSIGSNINEFSLYIALAIAIIIFSEKDRDFENTMLVKYRTTIIMILGFAGFLSLSRALYLSISLCLITFITINMASILYKRRKLKSITTMKIMQYLAFAIISVIIFMYFSSSGNFDQHVINNIGQRFSFLLNIGEITEGVSSQDRLMSINSIKELIRELSLFPTLMLGEGTFIHNTFLQYLLEFGLINSAIALIFMIFSINKNIYLAIVLMVYMGVHHILYNPILYIGWFIVNYSKNKFSPTILPEEGPNVII